MAGRRGLGVAMLGIRISFPASKRGASAKERSGVRKSSVHADEAEIATNCGFGDVHLNRSLSVRFTPVSPHFVVGRYQWQI